MQNKRKKEAILRKETISELCNNFMQSNTCVIRVSKGKGKKVDEKHILRNNELCTVATPVIPAF